MRENLPFVVAAVAYVAIGLPVLLSLERDIPLPFGDAFLIPLAVTSLYLTITLLAVIGRHVFVARRPPFELATWRLVGTHWLPPRRAVGVLIVLALLPVFLTVMLGFRTALTTISPFRWDVPLARLDTWLHGGTQPWKLLQPLLGHPVITRVLDLFYVYGWFSLLWIGVAWQTVHGREPVRSRFLLTFVLTWILLGTVGAIAFSSAGPVYYGRVTDAADPYTPLMAYLHAVSDTQPLLALTVQERLWSTYTSWGGITAMPSMHVAQAFVVVLAGINTHRRLAWVLIPALALVVLGSVHLGWHYAVDAYVSLLATAGIWYAAGHVSRWWYAGEPAAQSWAESASRCCDAEVP